MRKVIIVSIIGVIIGIGFIYLYNKENVKNKGIVISNDEVEKYTKDALERIMNEYNSKEAIKALSVIIRTCYLYGKTTDTLDESKEYINNMYDTKVKIDTKLATNIKEVLKDTKNEVITYKGELIFPFFHRVSPLNTRVGDKVAGYSFPYLLSTRCNDDVKSSDFIQIKYYKKEEILKRFDIKEANIDIKKCKISISNTDTAGYVYGININGTHEIDVNEFIAMLKLNSSNFVIEEFAPNEELIRIVCKGKGNGMGFSINDAYYLSKKGYEYKELLNKYYRDIEIKKIYY